MKLTNQRTFVALVIQLLVQLKRMSKISWETIVFYKCLCGEWTAVKE